MYAIIATGGKQYKVAEGDIIKVEKLNAEEGSEVSFDVVAVNTDKDVLCGDACKSASVRQLFLAKVRVRRLLFTSTRERLDIIRRMVTDRHILKLRLTKSMLNW